MSKLLVSFLGKARPDQGGEYRKTRYLFEGDVIHETANFGVALARATGVDTLRILGTSGSMWDVLLLEVIEKLDEQSEAALDALSEAVAEDRVTQAQLDALKPALERIYPFSLELRLTGYGFDQADQVALLGAIADGVVAGDVIQLDVTHGLRHLPMLVLLASFYLGAVKRVEVAGIWYGAFDCQSADGITPAVNLGGMLRLLDWTQAMASFAKDGDYGVFGKLLSAEGGRGELLEEAAFFERTSNPTRAREKLQSFINAPEEPSTSLGRLFLPVLEENAGWRKQGNRYQWESRLAQGYLERRDYLRAVLYAYEALITRQLDLERGNQHDFGQREETSKTLKKQSKDFRTLEYLRNAMAHGLRSQDDEVASLLADESRLDDYLCRLFKKQLPPR